MDAPYCEVALPVPLRSVFTYAVPATLREQAVPGSRVVVPFGRRAMVGVALRRTNEKPEVPKIREIVQVLESVPALPASLLELGRWVSDYYVAPVGEVFRAMLPPLVEVRTTREVSLTPAGTQGHGELSSRRDLKDSEKEEWSLLAQLLREGKPVGVTALRKNLRAEAVLGRLQRRGWIEMREVAAERKGRTQRIVAWKGQTAAAEESKSTATTERIRRILAEERGPLPVPLLVKIARVSRAAVARLIRAGTLESWEEPCDPGEDPFDTDFTPPANALNAEQERAMGEIRTWLDAREFTVGLLHGVTGSGKTEVYLRSVQEALARGRTALILVPEIALTLWVGRLCRAWFGAEFEGVAVMHSALGDAERAREWWRVRRGEARVVVGTRSAMFAPLENLGLVVVDEEQEASYKQEETPRYHGRDVAIVRAGKYRLLQLESRVENRPLSPVEIVDLREDFRATHRAGPLSSKLSEAITARLDQGTQSLILINRRGYSWFVICRSCGAGIQCENCSISLTYHKQRDRLECHYCGFSRRVPKECPKCASEHVYFFGAGAEQLEEKLREKFPGAKVARLDRDAVRTKGAYQQVLADFASGKINILVGTQMVAKGHDFQRVTLVGVVSADSQLSLPDFRAAERTFQLLTQVAGRAGRGDLPGEVLVETYYPEHYAIQLAARQDYLAFFEKELQFRRLLHYPPFTALASILVRDTKIENAIRWSRQLSAFLAPQESRGVKVLGPAAAPLARLKREFRFQFLLKAPKRTQLTRVLSELLAFSEQKEIPERAVLVDVDPLSLF